MNFPPDKLMCAILHTSQGPVGGAGHLLPAPCVHCGRRWNRFGWLVGQGPGVEELPPWRPSTPTEDRKTDMIDRTLPQTDDEWLCGVYAKTPGKEAAAMTAQSELHGRRGAGENVGIWLIDGSTWYVGPKA